MSDGTNLKKVCPNGNSASSVTVELLPKLHFAENVASDIQPKRRVCDERPTDYLLSSSIKEELFFRELLMISYYTLHSDIAENRARTYVSIGTWRNPGGRFRLCRKVRHITRLNSDRTTTGTSTPRRS